MWNHRRFRRRSEALRFLNDNDHKIECVSVAEDPEYIIVYFRTKGDR